jgi:DNA polymerase-1
MSKQTELNALNNQIKHCSQCDSTVNTIGTGSLDASIMIVKTAPSFININERNFFNIALNKCGISSDVYITFLPKCGKRFEDKLNKQIKNCFPLLEKEIEIINPKVIITVGKESTAALTKERAITKVRGNIYRYKDYFVIPTYTSSDIANNPKLIDYLIDDVATAVRLINNRLVKKHYTICYNQDTAVKYLRDLKENATIFSCDIESTGLNFVNDTILGVGFSYKRHHAFYIPARLLKRKNKNLFFKHHRASFKKRNKNKNNKILKLIIALLTDPNKVSILFNGKFDNLFFRYHHDFKIMNFKYDPMLMSHLIDVNARHDLKSQSRIFPDLAGYDDELNEILPKSKKKDRDFKKVPIEILGMYCCTDCESTRRLFPIFYEKLVNMGLINFYNEVTHPLQDILGDMEYRGIDIDKPALIKLMKDYDNKVIGSEKAIYMYAGKEFNINSTQQLGEILFKDMKIKPIKETPKGANSTDDEVLRKLSLQGITIAQFLCDYRKFSKINSTYVKALKEKHISNDDKVHCSYNMHIARTLRLSSSKPNLQNIPRDGGIREVYVPPKDHVFIIADFSQIELKKLAFFSKDPVMLKIYEDDLDIHAATGLELFGKDNMTVNERTAAKEVNFGMVYGITAFGLVKNINESLMDMGVKDPKEFITEREAEQFIHKWFSKYRDVRAWIREEKKRLFNQGYAENYFGIRRKLIKLYSKDKRERGEALKEGISTIVQGTAACYINKALVKTAKAMKKDGLDGIYMTLPVHDEVAFIVPNLGDTFLKNVAEYVSKKLTTDVVPEIEKVVKMKVDYKICDRWSK